MKLEEMKQITESIIGREVLLPGNYIDDSGEEHHNSDDKFVVVEDFLTLASFLEGNPIATEAVKTVVDLIFNGKRAEAEEYLSKNHNDIKDQVTSLVTLAPHVAAKITGEKIPTEDHAAPVTNPPVRRHDDESDHNED